MLVAPFGVLITKWGAMEAASGIGVWSTLILILLMAGSGATTVFWVKWMGRLLCHRPVPGSAKAEPMIPLYHGILGLFIACAVVFSILIVPVYNGVVAPYLNGAEAGYGLAFTTGHWFLNAPGIGMFAAWPLFIVAALALIIPSLRVKVKPEESRAAYLCGENVEIGTDEFMALADERTELKTGGFYVESTLGERNLNRFIEPIGIIFLIVMFAMATI